MANRFLPVRHKFHLETILKSRATIIFFVGVMISLVINFWPKCQTCEDPQICLVFTECLKHGRVILEGSDACREDVLWTSGAVEILLDTTNISMSDLACENHSVKCHDVEDLKQRNCTKGWLGTADDSCKESVYSHEFDDQWPKVSCRDYFCSSDFDWRPWITS